MGVVVPYTADEVQCTGSEASLAECSQTSECPCRPSVEAAGVICKIETNGTQRVKRKKRASAAAVLESAYQGSSSIIGSAIEYFEKKEKESQGAGMSSEGVEIKIKHDKGYKDEGGEFQDGGANIKIQDIEKPSRDSHSAEESHVYPVGIGPILINGCYGSGYGPGDPCYAYKRLSDKCLDQLEAANYIGVGFDATGGYTHAGRRKSLIQRVCAKKRTYQGEDVPDNMNVFGIYDTGCQGKTFDSLEARSRHQREQSKLSENEDFLKYSSSSITEKEQVTNYWTASGQIKFKHKSESEMNTNTETSEEGRGQASTSRSISKSSIFEFACRIRRYEIFLDEVTPWQLSEAFLQDYINLPLRYFDFKNKAPAKYAAFLERWGTHYIKAASFGGKFTIVRESTISEEETEKEWSASMQNSVSSMFESQESSSSSTIMTSTSQKEMMCSLGNTCNTCNTCSTCNTCNTCNTCSKEENKTESSQNASMSGKTSESSKAKTESAKERERAKKEEKKLSVDDLIVEGGSQTVASILSDRDRSGFKTEFKDWLESIPQFPKGYDFKFGELSELVNINFQSLLGDFLPCWLIPGHYVAWDDENNEVMKYDVKTKDEEGNEKIEPRICIYRNISDFNNQMELRRMSLKRAINVYAKNKGRSSTDLVIPPGEPDCERKLSGVDSVTYPQLTDGRDYLVAFDLLNPIGKKISQTQMMSISFKASLKSAGGNKDGTVGRWAVNSEKITSAGQLSSKVTLDYAAKKVILMGIMFTYSSDDTGNTLEWTKADCQKNLWNFPNLRGRKGTLTLPYIFNFQMHPCRAMTRPTGWIRPSPSSPPWTPPWNTDPAISSGRTFRGFSRISRVFASLRPQRGRSTSSSPLSRATRTHGITSELLRSLELFVIVV